MTIPSSTPRLYPLLLAVADVGVGLALYETGSIAFAVMLWLAGLVTCLGVLGALVQSVDGRIPLTSS